MFFYFTTGTMSPLARAVSAELRSEMAVQRVTGRALAGAAQYASHNYVAERLRDEKPFTLDDVDRLCQALGVDSGELIQRALRNHGPRLQLEAVEEFGAWHRAKKAEPLSNDLTVEEVLAEVDAELARLHEDESEDARRAATRLDERVRRTPRSQAAMQQMQDQAARNEGKKA